MEPIRLRGPADVLAALPYQLGYHPQDSLVVVALHGTAVGMVARVDLPDEGDVDAVASVTVEPLLRERPDGVLLVGYESRPSAAGPLLDEVASRVAAAGLDVVDRLVVRGGRWFSRRLSAVGATGTGPDPNVDRPPGEDAAGEPLPDPSRTPAVAEFVALGVVPLPDRSALAALVAPDAAVCRDVARALRRRRSHVGAAFGLPAPPPPGTTPEGAAHAEAVRRLGWLSSWKVVCDVGPEAVPVDALGAATIAELVCSLEDILLRDGIIGWLCPGTLPLEALPPDLADQLRTVLPAPAWHVLPRRHESVVAGRRLLARLQWLARAVPDADAAPVLTVVASLAWWLGDGTAARVALDRARASAPSYRLARLLEGMVGLGVPHWSRKERPVSGRAGRGRRPLV